MIFGLQIVAVIFAFFMMYFSLVNFKRREISKIELLSWVSIWIVTIFIVLFPDLLRKYSSMIAISRVFDLMVVGGFILVILMISITYVRVKRIEKKINELVRKDALKKIK